MRLLNFIFLMLLLMPLLKVQAEFDPEKLSQSTVRIQIKHQGAVVAVASGFVWKKPTQIVTSLHVLHADPTSQIIIEFAKKRRKAKIKSLLPEADLVLLEVKRPIDGWQALTYYNGDKPPYKARVTALGFNQGALGMSTRELVKGYAKPEQLSQLLPKHAGDILAKTNIPKVTLPIYYLDGSLLPGYSGSPIVDSNGQLIGIGDGGLENGAASVSWVIPARYLTQLEQSTITQLPQDINKTKKLFSTENVEHIQLSHKEKSRNDRFSFLDFLFNKAHAQSQQNISTSITTMPYREVNYQNFNFVKVKTRAFSSLMQTTGSIEKFKQLFVIFKRFVGNIHIDFSQQYYDIYTDAHYGLNIVVPAGVDLIVDDDGYLLTEGKMFCQHCPFEIQYHARKLKEKQQETVKNQSINFLNAMADVHWQELNLEGDYDEYRDFRQIENVGSHRYLLRALFSDFSEPFKSQFELNYYSAATSRDAWFQAQGIINIFDNTFIKSIKKHQDLNCQQSNLNAEQAELCHHVTQLFNVLASTHLTSFSNRIFL